MSTPLQVTAFGSFAARGAVGDGPRISFFTSSGRQCWLERLPSVRALGGRGQNWGILLAWGRLHRNNSVNRKDSTLAYAH